MTSFIFYVSFRGLINFGIVVVENVFSCPLYKINVLIGNERKEERGKRELIKSKSTFILH